LVRDLGISPTLENQGRDRVTRADPFTRSRAFEELMRVVSYSVPDLFKRSKEPQNFTSRAESNFVRANEAVRPHERHSLLTILWVSFSNFPRLTGWHGLGIVSGRFTGI
jgi:hypothetical protein